MSRDTCPVIEQYCVHIIEMREILGRRKPLRGSLFFFPYVRPLRTSLSNNRLRMHQSLLLCTPTLFSVSPIHSMAWDKGEESTWMKTEKICLINGTGFSYVLLRLSSARFVFIFFFNLRQDNGGHCIFFLRLLKVLPARFGKRLIWVELESLKARCKHPICVRNRKETYAVSPQKSRHAKFVQNRPGDVQKRPGKCPFQLKVKIKTRAPRKNPIS